MSALADLHKRVIHIEKAKASESHIELENKLINSYPDDLLNVICSDCFGKKSVEDMI